MNNSILAMEQNIRITSLNCAGVKNKLPIINDLCEKADIIFLQETWILPTELDLLNSVNKEFTSSLSAVNLHDGILVGGLMVA